MATAETADAYLQQVHSTRTQLQACFRRAHEILTDREADLLRQLDDIQTSYEQETNNREEEIQNLDNSELFLKTSVHDNDTLNKALVPLTDKLEQLQKLTSAARTVRFQWNTAIDEDILLAGEIITTSSVPPTVIPHSSLTPVIPQTSILSPNLTPVIPQTSIPSPNLTPVILQTDIPQLNFTPSFPDNRNKSRPVISCCKQGTALGQLSWPTGLAIEAQFGRIFIADSDNNRVQVYTPDGEYCFMFNSNMDWPRSICIYNNTVYVSQFRSHCITLYKLYGKCLNKIDKYVNKIGSEGTSNGHFKSPRGIAVSATSEHIYVCDAGNNRVQIFNKSLKYHSHFGNNTLNEPKDIKLSNDSVIVLDASNPCIHIFSITDCSLLNSIISRGTADAEIGNSFCFTMDAGLNLLLTDDTNHCIKVFSNTGDFITQIGRRGEDIGELYYPAGIAIDSLNRIIVVSNSKNCSLQIF